MKNELAGWKSTAAQAGLLSGWMKSFASEIIGHVLSGGILDDAALQRIKIGCLRDLKNIEVTGLRIEDEADFLGKVIQHFDQMKLKKA